MIIKIIVENFEFNMVRAINLQSCPVFLTHPVQGVWKKVPCIIEILVVGIFFLYKNLEFPA